MHRSPAPRANVTIKVPSGWIDLPPSQDGLAAALRRAFAAPEELRTHEFDELLRKLS